MDWIGCYSYEVKHYKAYSAELREISFKFCIFNELFYLQRSIGSLLEIHEHPELLQQEGAASVFSVSNS